MEKYFHPSQPLRSIICGSSSSGKSIFLTNLFLNVINDYNKIYIYSPSLHQDLYQKFLEGFNTYLPIHIIPKSLNEEDSDLVIDEIVTNKDFEKSHTEIETFDNIQELKYPQEYDDGGINILDNINKKEMKDPRVQAMFRRSRHNNPSIFLISQDF